MNKLLMKKWGILLVSVIAITLYTSLIYNNTIFPQWPFWLIGVTSVALIKLVEKKKTEFLTVPPKKKIVLGVLIFFYATMTITWGIYTFPLKHADQVFATLAMPIGGFGLVYLKDVFFRVIPCSLILSFALIPILSTLCRLMRPARILRYAIYLVLGWNAFLITKEIHIKEYITEFKRMDTLKVQNSDLYLKHYSPVTAEMLHNKTEGGNTNNLIIIIAESFENFNADLIPASTELVSQGISFSDSGKILGGHDMPGSLNTISGTVAKTTGVPLLTVRNNALKDMLNGKGYLTRVPSVYDLLHKVDYYNVFLQGSDASFAGSKDFLTSHGVDMVYDMTNLNATKDMEADFWHSIVKKFPTFTSFESGYTDQTVLNSARSILDTLKKKNHFTLTIATIDTHYPYGFYNKECKEKPEDVSDKSSLIATIKCSDRLIGEVVDWVKQQDFANNTTIVLLGDHLFMGDMAETISPHRDRRWLTTFINTPARPARNDDRMFTSLDIAPTLLEGAGFELEGHRMGFGVSLFADDSTLMEKLGRSQLDAQATDMAFAQEYLNLFLPENND